MANHVRTFADLFRKAEQSEGYWAKRTVFGFTNDLARVMAAKGLTRADLARLIGSSQAYITKVFNHDANFTVRTMAKLAHALDSEVRIHIAPKGSRTVWFDEISAYSGHHFTSKAAHEAVPADALWNRSTEKREEPAYTPVRTAHRGEDETITPAA